MMAALGRHPARVAVMVLLAAMVGGLVALWPGQGMKTATAYFPTAVHIYPGSDVDILGVKVGSILSVTPVGNEVQVRFEYSGKYRLPAGVRAAFVEPTLVADRVLQLDPPYGGGPVFPDGGVIPATRTAVPIELDQFDEAVTQLATALGPAGANRTGALAQAVDVGAANLTGQGARLNRALTGVASMLSTLGDNSGPLFQTVGNLQQFVAELAQHDSDTRNLLTELSGVSAFLDSQRSAFGTALNQLGGALDELAAFIRGNGRALSSNVAALASVSTVLANDRMLLAHILDMGAVGVTSYPHMYTPSARTYNARFDGNPYYQTPALWMCQLYQAVGGNPYQCLGYLGPLQKLAVPPSVSGP